MFKGGGGEIKVTNFDRIRKLNIDDMAIIEELSGMNILMEEYQIILFSLLCKLKGLTILTKDKDFSLYRRTIFECLGLMGELTSCLDITI